MMPSLRDELVFYGSYHTNKWNQLIHFIFVPILIFSVLVWLAYIGPVVPVDTSALKHLPDWIAKYAPAGFLLCALTTRRSILFRTYVLSASGSTRPKDFLVEC